MATDARISTGLPSHPKTKKLIRRLGPAGGWSLVCLILWAASNRSDGNLSGMTGEDIELAADWDGEAGAFVQELAALKFFDEVDGGYRIHDWAEHNPWAAGADMRSHKARWNAAKRHHGLAEADRLVPEYAAIRNAGSSADSNSASTDAAQGQHTNGEHVAKSSNAPSPSPSPSPIPTSPPIGGGDAKTRPARKCPADFTVTDELRAWAADKAPLVDLQKATDSFRDHTFKTAITDWAGAWRNWLRKDQQFASERSGPANKASGKHSGFQTMDYREGVNADGSFV